MTLSYRTTAKRRMAKERRQITARMPNLTMVGIPERSCEGGREGGWEGGVVRGK